MPPNSQLFFFFLNFFSLRLHLLGGCCCCCHVSQHRLLFCSHMYFEIDIDGGTSSGVVVSFHSLVWFCFVLFYFHLLLLKFTSNLVCLYFQIYAKNNFYWKIAPKTHTHTHLHEEANDIEIYTCWFAHTVHHSQCLLSFLYMYKTVLPIMFNPITNEQSWLFFELANN